jgi:hypothetical protein
MVYGFYLQQNKRLSKFRSLFAPFRFRSEGVVDLFWTASKLVLKFYAAIRSL